MGFHIAIVDLDGTLYYTEDIYQRYLGGGRSGKPDWDGYFTHLSEATLIKPAADLVGDLMRSKVICYLSGRRADCIRDTVDALVRDQLYPPGTMVQLRQPDDRRPAVEYKLEAVRRLQDKGHTIDIILDDDPMVFSAFRQLELPVLLAGWGKR